MKENIMEIIISNNIIIHVIIYIINILKSNHCFSIVVFTVH